MSKINRAILIVLDSVGVGYQPDADEYGDKGANTLKHICEAYPDLKIKNLKELGLGNIADLALEPAKEPIGAYGIAGELSPGKDTTTGHWEIAGLVLSQSFPTYPDGFPKELIEKFEKVINKKSIGNYASSGTVILNELGEEHMKTGFPIVYTSADSVFQIAAHEDIIPVKELYTMCEKARALLTGKHAVGRVIARPFLGEPGNFSRTSRRHDFSLEPTGPTILSKMKEKGLDTIGVGKIYDIFAGHGVSYSTGVNENNLDGINKTIDLIKKDSKGLIFTNLVDFDMVYGHRNNVKGYANALEEFDAKLPEIYKNMKEDDILILTADHGCDPTYKGTDHTREYIPILVWGKKLKSNIKLGLRKSFADIAKTIGDIFDIEIENGESFLKSIL